MYVIIYRIGVFTHSPLTTDNTLNSLFTTSNPKKHQLKKLQFPTDTPCSLIQINTRFVVLLVCKVGLYNILNISTKYIKYLLAYSFTSNQTAYRRSVLTKSKYNFIVISDFSQIEQTPPTRHCTSATFCYQILKTKSLFLHSKDKKLLEIELNSHFSLESNVRTRGTLVWQIMTVK